MTSDDVNKGFEVKKNKKKFVSLLFLSFSESFHINMLPPSTFYRCLHSSAHVFTLTDCRCNKRAKRLFRSWKVKNFHSVFEFSSTRSNKILARKFLLLKFSATNKKKQIKKLIVKCKWLIKFNCVLLIWQNVYKGILRLNCLI